MDSGATEKIATFIAETTFDRIPPEAVDAAKQAILDCIGATIGGSGEPAVRIMAEQVKQYGAAGAAGVVGRAFRTAAEWAAWINGTAGHALDYDDTFSDAAGYNFHPTVPVLPAVLALAEASGASGKELLAAYITGIEVESRVGAAIGRSVSEAGWHTTPVIGTIGAAAGCANLLKLRPGEARVALGIAGSLSSGILQNFGTNTKPLHAGNASRNGVVSALLAKGGFTANESILEGAAGFCGMVSGKRVSTIEPHEQDLGRAWDIVSPGLALKPYPCCRATHSCIDASLELRKVLGGAVDQVAGIVCKVSRHQTTLARFHDPKNAYEAKFSIPYCVAAALLRGRIVLEDFTEEQVADLFVRALLAKVEFQYPEEEYVNNPMGLNQEVVITLASGKEYASKVRLPKGEPENPMTTDELSAKFADCARGSFSQTVIDALLETIAHLESLDAVSRLMDAITYPTKD